MPTVRQLMLNKMDVLSQKVDALSRIVIPTDENLENIYTAMDQMIHWAERTIEVMRQQEEYYRRAAGRDPPPDAAVGLKY